MKNIQQSLLEDMQFFFTKIYEKAYKREKFSYFNTPEKLKLDENLTYCSIKETMVDLQALIEERKEISKTAEELLNRYKEELEKNTKGFLIEMIIENLPKGIARAKKALELLNRHDDLKLEELKLNAQRGPFHIIEAAKLHIVAEIMANLPEEERLRQALELLNRHDELKLNQHTKDLLIDCLRDQQKNQPQNFQDFINQSEESQNRSL